MYNGGGGRGGLWVYGKTCAGVSRGSAGLVGLFVGGSLWSWQLGRDQRLASYENNLY